MDILLVLKRLSPADVLHYVQAAALLIQQHESQLHASSDPLTKLLTAALPIHTNTDSIVIASDAVIATTSKDFPFVSDYAHCVQRAALLIQQREIQLHASSDAHAKHLTATLAIAIAAAHSQHNFSLSATIACSLCSDNDFSYCVQGAALLIQQHESQLRASSETLTKHMTTAVPIDSTPNSTQPAHIFITVAAHSALCDSLDLVSRLAEEARTADQQHAYSGIVPGWAQGSAALQQAAQQAGLLRAQSEKSESHGQNPLGKAEGEEQQARKLAMHGQGDEADFGEEEQGRQQLAVAELGQRWQEQVEQAVKGMLLWAQNVQGTDDEQGTDAGTRACQQKHYIQRCSACCSFLKQLQPYSMMHADVT